MLILFWCLFGSLKSVFNFNNYLLLSLDFFSFGKIETSESYGIPLLHKILASKIERHSQNKESSSSCFLYILSSLPGRRYFRRQVSKSLNRKQPKM